MTSTPAVVRMSASHRHGLTFTTTTGQVHGLLADLDGGVQVGGLAGQLEPGQGEHPEVRHEHGPVRVAGRDEVQGLPKDCGGGVQVSGGTGLLEPGEA
jgi:hypothetical protein